MNEQLRKLLQGLGISPAIITKYSTDDEEALGKLKPADDAKGQLEKIKEVHKNDIEHEIKESAASQAKAEVYGTIEGKVLKKIGKTRADVAKAKELKEEEVKFDHILEVASEVLSADDDVAELQNQLVEANKQVNKLKEDVDTEKQATEKFKLDWQRDQHVLSKIGKSKTIIPQDAVFKLVKDDLYGKYSVVREGDDWVLRDKENPKKQVKKNDTEFYTLDDVLGDMMEPYTQKSNGGDGGDDGGEGGKPPITQPDAGGDDKKPAFEISRTAQEREKAMKE